MCPWTIGIGCCRSKKKEVDVKKIEKYYYWQVCDQDEGQDMNWNYF